MTKKDKKLILETIVRALTDRGIKDFMTGAIIFTWNPVYKKNEYSIWMAAEDVFKALNIDAK